MTATHTAAAIGLLALAAVASAQTMGKKVYIVQLADAPAAAYTGGQRSLAATRPAAGAKLDTALPAVRAYVAHLTAQQNTALARVGNVPALHRYTTAFNGFAAALTDAQVIALRSTSSVKSVVPSELRRLDTSQTPAFLGLTAPGGLWSRLDAASRQVKGDDVIIGVIDSGIWPEDPSFGDKLDADGRPVAYNQAGTLAYDAPTGWRGICQTGPGFTAAMCNAKLIGARFYADDFKAQGGVPAALEFLSPRDGNGHGSHTASTAGGNANAPASIGGVPAAAISGIAPRARIASYKVCWEATSAEFTGCQTADVLKAIDDAVADGVDVINYSVSGSQFSFGDPVELAYLNASAAGVFVATSAGNAGPANQVAHVSPWLTTVAASTHDRLTVASVSLGNGSTFSGPSYQGTGLPQTPMVLARDGGTLPFASLNAADQTALQRCYNAADRAEFGGSASAALDPAKVAGKVVVCYRGANALVNKGDAVRQAGGRAMLLQNVPALPPNLPASSDTVPLLPYAVPTVHLTAASYAAVAGHAGSAGAAASFGPGVQQTGVVAPVMADFSSRGPNKANADILKPDISAPGVDIVAAFKDAAMTQAEHDALVLGNHTPRADATSLQGTSMASPHVAGAAALLRQLYPAWSPAAIKSALMTSTTGVKLASGALDTNRWGYGAGHLAPNGAANPGLVYDLAAADYARFLCGRGLAPPAGLGTCATLGATISPSNLNLASLTAANVMRSRTLTRRVTNVSGASATFVASASLPNWTVVVSPPALTLAPGESKSFTVALTANAGAIGAWSFGNLTWTSNAHAVRSPLSASAVGFSAPVEVADTRPSGTGSKTFSIVTAYTGPMSVSATGLVPATLTAGSLVKAAVQCTNFNVASGAQVARFQLFNADTQGGAATNLDLEVFKGANGTGPSVGSSATAGSDEMVTLKSPAAGTHSACVSRTDTGAAAASYTLSSWVVGAPGGAQTLRAAAPPTVYENRPATVGISWSVAAGKRYLGTVRYLEGGGATIGTTLVLVDNR